MAYAALAGLRLSSMHVMHHISYSHTHTLTHTCVYVVHHFSQTLYGSLPYVYICMYIYYYKSAYSPAGRKALSRFIGGLHCNFLSGKTELFAILSISFYGPRKCIS